MDTISIPRVERRARGNRRILMEDTDEERAGYLTNFGAKNNEELYGEEWQEEEAEESSEWSDSDSIGIWDKSSSIDSLDTRADMATFVADGSVRIGWESNRSGESSENNREAGTRADGTMGADEKAVVDHRSAQALVAGISYPPELLLESLYLYLDLIRSSANVSLQRFADCRLVSRGWKPLVEDVLFRRLRITDMHQWMEIRQSFDAHPEIFLLIKECEILCEWPKLSNDLSECAHIGKAMPNLRRLCIHFPDSDYHNDLVSIGTSFSRVSELAVVGMRSRRALFGYTDCYGDGYAFKHMERPAWFPSALPFLQVSEVLASLDLSHFEFPFRMNECHEFPVALRRLVLRNCIDYGGSIDQIFKRSCLTLQHFVAFPSLRNAIPMLPTFITSETPWEHIALVKNDRNTPSCISGVKTLCCTLHDIAISAKNLGDNFLDEVHRVILTCSGHNQVFSLASLVQPLWSSLRWLEFEYPRFDQDNSELFFGTFGGVLNNIQVLAFHGYRYIPSNLGALFPNLHALLLDGMNGRSLCSMVSSSGEAVWLVPSLRIVSLQRISEFRTEIYNCFIAGFASQHGLSDLRMIVLPPHWEVDEPDELVVECGTRGVDITTESICFEDWARRIIK